MSQKAAILVFCEKTRCFKFHSDGKYVLVMLQVDNEIGLLLELYITKNSLFAFLLLKDVPLNFIAQKICFGLFGVKLGSFQPASDLDFYLIVFKRMFQPVFCSATLSSVLSFLEQPFATFPYMKYVFDALTYQNYALVSLERVGDGLSRVRLNKLLPAILQEKHVFGLCAVELRCFQRYCTGQRFPASLRCVTQIFT